MRTVQTGDKAIVFAEGEEMSLTDAQSALDLIASVRYAVENADAIVMPKALINEDFFQLSTGLAGEILQKYINYGMKLAIVGDFSSYASKALRDFIRESNRGKDIFFVPTEEEAIALLSAALA